MKIRRFTVGLLAAVALAISASDKCLADDVDILALTRAVNSVQPEGKGHREAIDAVGRLSSLDAEQLPEILAGFVDGQRLGENWLRLVVEAISQRSLAAGEQLPVQKLESFIIDTTHAPRARRLAYELLIQVDSKAHDRLIPEMLNDPSLELRRDAVAYALAQADKVAESDRVAALTAYRKALTAARAKDQVDTAAKKLRDLGEAVDLPKHFGFIVRWKLIAPFDNREDCGYDVKYGPESNPDPNAKYDGKEGTIAWKDVVVDDPYGMVDINELLDRFKGAVAYAYTEFESDEARDVELRLGCITANKIYLNGELLTENHVYHSGTYMDQYVAKGRLKPGKNVILLKICQNEQTDSWAQRWQFQFRVCDSLGTAILSTDR